MSTLTPTQADSGWLDDDPTDPGPGAAPEEVVAPRRNGHRRRPDEAPARYPHSAEAEAALIGAHLLDGDAPLPALDPADFYVADHGHLWRAIQECRRAGQTADAVTVAVRLPADRPDLRQLLNTVQIEAPTPRGAEADRRYGPIVADHAWTRQLGGWAKELDLAVRAGHDVAALLERQPKRLAAGGRGLERSRLGDLMAGGIPEPTMVHTWLYAGGLHSIQAEPGVGKSWVALWLAVSLIDAGEAVLYLDEEGGEELVVERLVALGADPAQVDRHLHYFPFPGRRWDEEDVAALAAAVADATSDGTTLGMVVLDSLPDFLAAAALSEDSGRDVTDFAHRILAPVRDAGGALVVLDHLVKPDPDNTRRSRYSRGSGAKLAKPHLSILLETGEDFDAQTSGALKVWKTKDRRGRVPLPNIKQQPAILAVTVKEGRVTIDQMESTGTPDQPVWDGPTRCIDACRHYLQRTPGQPFTGSQVAKALIDPSTRHGYRRDTVFEALRILESQPASGITSRPGPRNSLQYTYNEMTLDDEQF